VEPRAAVASAPVRYGTLIDQDAALDVLTRRWQRAEGLGFDALYINDHSMDYRGPGGPWFDGLTLLAPMAERTQGIRIGPLVANPILRAPQLLARQAHALDHLSGGRLELGIGTGVADFDYAAMGAEPLSPKARAERLRGYVATVDELLRGDELLPPTPQRPRPPITIGGQSPTVLRIAAERADCWNTHGPFGASFEEILALTREQNARLDEMCAEHGREAGALRRSLLMFGPLDAWASPDAFERVVTAFAQIGIQEFVAFWPPPEHAALVERAAAFMASARA
jgi:alkanesulfonate monooxygenase SsuD/methylene tetrahydromethanopterin reductase-like flavin-dependent oxidoreductase (luciferase family)